MPNETVTAAIIDRQIIRQRNALGQVYLNTTTCSCGRVDCSGSRTTNTVVPLSRTPIRYRCYWNEHLSRVGTEGTCTNCGAVRPLLYIRGTRSLCAPCVSGNYTPCWGCERPIRNGLRSGAWVTNNPEIERRLDADMGELGFEEFDQMAQNNPHYALYLCRQCTYSDPNVCQVCNDSPLDGSTRTITLDGTERRACLTCLERNIAVCRDCGQHTRANTAIVSTHTFQEREDGIRIYDRICRNCYGRWQRCPNCDAAVEPQEHDEGNEYCEGCLSSELHNNILPYNTNPLNYLSFLGTESQHFLGVELELEFTGKRNRRELNEALNVAKQIVEGSAIIKNDGSLDCGIEIASAPMTLEYHKLVAWEDKLGSLGQFFQPKDTCGLHIHTSRSPLSNSVVRLIGDFIFNEQNYEFVRFMARRDESSYARIRNVDRSTASHNRYLGLNVCRPDTIEFRLFAATTNPRLFYASLEFADALTRFALAQNRVTVIARPTTGSGGWASSTGNMTVPNFLTFVERLDNDKYRNLKSLVSTFNFGLGF